MYLTHLKQKIQRETLAKDCYNLALQNSQDPQADRKFTIHLLEESHSIYDKLENKDSSLQSRTLRWLASEYLACENFSKALQTIQLANHVRFKFKSLILIYLF